MGNNNISNFHAFNKKEDKWEPLTNKTPQNPQKETLTVMTYNIWFNYVCDEVRYPAILDIVAQHDPDIVCFQEGNFTYLV